MHSREVSRFPERGPPSPQQVTARQMLSVVERVVWLLEVLRIAQDVWCGEVLRVWKPALQQNFQRR